MNSDFPSIYVLAPFFGWFIAHVVKFVVTLVASGGREKSLKIFFRAGGMPSSHTSVMVSTIVVLAGTLGVGSPIFGLGVALTALVIYDALNVRRSVGEQGDVLRKVAAHTKVEDRFRIAYGHTGPEVVGGAVVGLVVGYILLQIL
jgi:acid phosphatase family membrane protein YuiD